MNVHELTLQNYTAASGCPSACQPILYLGTAGSYGNEQINVVLGEGWQGLTVKAVFQPCGVAVVVPDGGGVISVPWEATQSVVAYPHGRIVFEGVTDGRVLISTDIHYAVGSHSDTEGSNSQPPTPSEWEQYVDKVKGDADRAAQAAADAKAAVQDVKNAGAQAVTDIGAAKDSALDAISKAGEEAAGSITADVQAAKDAAAAAAQSAKDAAAELPKVQQAAQDALDDIATERENSLTALEDEGGKQQSAVAGAGASALEAIQQAGPTVTEQITQTGATQVGAVQSAGTTQVGLVNSAGQQQAENIAQAGSQQVHAVQAAGMAAVGTVNDARDDAVEEIETANAHSPQINPDTGYWQTWDTETGEYVDTTAKAQGPQGETGATPQLTIGTVTTLDPGEDATVTITGTAEAPVLNFGIPKGEQGDGSTSGSDLPATTAADSGKVPTVNAAGTGYELTGPYAPLSAAIIETVKGNPAVCEDCVEWGLQGMRVYGKSTQDGTPSPENPVPIVSAGDGGSVELNITGKNLINRSYLENYENWSADLATNSVYPDTNTDASNRGIKLPCASNTTYVVSFNADGTFPAYMYLCKYSPSGSLRLAYLTTTSVRNQSFSFSLKEGEFAYIRIGSIGIEDSFLLEIQKLIDFQVEIGSVATAYEPYTVQSFTFSTQNGLPGIPVDSGGNFVDADGQQWICNYRDYDAKKDIKAIEYIASYSNESVGDIWMSTTGQLTVGASVLYTLDTPIETPIPADELAAYRSLHTYDGTTVLTPDNALASLEVDYIVKPKAYIEKKLTAIEQKIQEVAAAQIDTQTGG